ncbi:MAG TPA: hypothetical protein VK679_14410, partial [Gemmatimonadaceae bacterium]|nr:hypothetical protein [Gemmatimonadaceae bacterium]
MDRPLRPERPRQGEREKGEQNELRQQRFDAIEDSHGFDRRESVNDRDGHRAALLQLPDALA